MHRYLNVDPPGKFRTTSILIVFFGGSLAKTHTACYRNLDLGTVSSWYYL